MIYKTEQEAFWAGDFGDDYIQRNVSKEHLASNLCFFSKALQRISPPKSVIEFGANVGMNLKAIAALYPNAELHGIEINAKAARHLEAELGANRVYNTSILDFSTEKKFELVLVKGVLIHIAPTYLDKVYEKLFHSAEKYVLLCEYYNPSPIEVSYRGHSNRLFKRDFAGDLLKKFQSLSLIDYGFVYRYDPSFPQDDVNWFLLKKN